MVKDSPKLSQQDLEAARPKPARISHWKLILDQGIVTDDILNWRYKGSGTQEDPYIVKWIDHDPRNPLLFSEMRKWTFTLTMAVATLAVAFCSSAYSGGIVEIMETFAVSEEVATVGISLFVVGFALGPLNWAPMSELYGRQVLFAGTYAALTAFNAGAAGSQNITTLLLLRFFAGAFGSSPLTNAGGVIADMFPANERGMAMSIFAAAPFAGPALGPFIGGFIGETVGWRWVEGVMAIFTGVLWIVAACIVPETYGPILLRKRAQRLSQITGKVYMSQADAEHGIVTPKKAFKTSMSRPWILLFKEPIVFLLSLYMAIVYGTLYMLFGAFPYVFQVGRGWSAGVGGLSFMGVLVGMLLAVTYSIFDNKRYIRAGEESPTGYASPEARLPPCMIGACCIPVGLIWFAWTDSPSVHWIVSIMAGAPFGFGMVLVFLDAYVIFAASVLAANTVLRSLFGAAFPLFVTYMYRNLGIHWATMIPAFLALACVPFPFLFYKYGAAIRLKCKYAAEADEFLRKMRGELDSDSEDEPAMATGVFEKEANVHDNEDVNSDSTSNVTPEVVREHEDEKEQEAFDYSYEEEDAQTGQASEKRFQSIKTQPQAQRGYPLSRSNTQGSARSARSNRSRKFAYEASPFEIDRVNTRDSFRDGAPSLTKQPSRTSLRSISTSRSAKSTR